MKEKKFNVLSIDGGGIRGIFSIMFLANLEEELKAKGFEKWQTYQHFQLICGTSTGGIIAMGLALGVPAREIAEMYLDNASEIFKGKKGFFSRLRYSAYDYKNLEMIVRNKFKETQNGEDPRLADCKTNICIPIYDLMEGRPSVLKSKYHDAFVRDYHIPAYQAVLATSAAPTYFDPYSSEYVDLKGVSQSFQNKVDGGVFANNPTLNGIIEAQKAFNLPLSQLAVLSIGTGYRQFCDSGIVKKRKGFKKFWKKKNLQRNKYGIHYWMLQRDKKRLIELFFQGQSQQVQNLVSLLKNGIDKREPDNFTYNRIDTQLDDTCDIELDETDKKKLLKLVEKANIEFQSNATTIIKNYCSN